MTVRKIFSIIYVSSFVLLALALTCCSYSRYAKKSYEQAKKDKPYDVIIVPGVPYEPNKVNTTMKMRVLWAKYLYDSGFTQKIIFSGSSVYSPFIESVVMKIMADSLGIPSQNTFSETKAEHSTENIYYSWKMANEIGFKKIALATDPFQAGMLKRFIERYCPGMKSIPIVMKVTDLENKTLPTINDSPAFVKDFVSIIERETLRQRLRGTRGIRVKEEVKAEKLKLRSTQSKSQD